MTLRYGIVGCSGIARASHAPGVAAAEGADLVACADVVPEVAREFAADHDLEAWYDDHADLLAEADLDAISVCTPNGAHRDVVVDAAEAGVDVLCEKPLEITPGGVEDALDAADAAGITLGGVFQYRTHTAVRRAREAVAEGALGDPVLGDVTVKWHRSPEYFEHPWHGSADLDGGALISQAIHGVDVLQWLMGGVEEVRAYADTLARDIEVIDTAAAALAFRNGAFGTVEATTATRPQHPVVVECNGTEGSLELRTGSPASLTIEGPDVDIDLGEAAFDGSHAAQIQDFVDAVREGREPMVTGREAAEAVDVVLAIHEAADRDGAVAVDAVR